MNFLVKLKWQLTKPRALLRALRRVGIWSTFRLVTIRFGSRQNVYDVRIPQLPHPVYVRGGGSTDTLALYEIFVMGEYECVQSVDSPRSIIDGGANIGLGAVYLLNRFPTARTISVEPFPEAVDLCHKNLKEYGTRATVIQGAIWPEEGNVCLDPQDEEWLNRVRPASSGAGTSAKAITMQSLVKMAGGSVDLLKLDVEGSEGEIFGRGSEEWLPCIRNIVIEIHSRDCFERVFAALNPYKYELLSRDTVHYIKNLRPK